MISSARLKNRARGRGTPIRSCQPRSILAAEEELRELYDDVLTLDLKLGHRGRNWQHRRRGSEESAWLEHHWPWLNRVRDRQAYLLAFIEAGGVNPGGRTIQEKRRRLTHILQQSQSFVREWEGGLDNPVTHFTYVATPAQAHARLKQIKKLMAKVEPALASMGSNVDELTLAGAKWRFLRTLNSRLLNLQRQYVERLAQFDKEKPLTAWGRITLIRDTCRLAATVVPKELNERWVRDWAKAVVDEPINVQAQLDPIMVQHVCTLVATYFAEAKLEGNARHCLIYAKSQVLPPVQPQQSVAA